MFWNLTFCMCFSSTVINTHTKFEITKKSIFLCPNTQYREEFEKEKKTRDQAPVYGLKNLNVDKLIYFFAIYEYIIII